MLPSLCNELGTKTRRAQGNGEGFPHLVRAPIRAKPQQLNALRSTQVLQNTSQPSINASAVLLLDV